MSRRMIIAPLLLLHVVGLLSACDAIAPVEGRVVSATKRGYDIEITTLPGLAVEYGDHQVEADESGVAHVEITVDELSYAKDAHDLTFMVRGRKLLTSYFGQVDVELPFTPKEAGELPDAPHWLKITGGDPGKPHGKLLLSAGDAGNVYDLDDGGYTMRLLGPGGATVTLLGKTATLDGHGRGEISISAAEMRSHIPSSAFFTGGSDKRVEAPKVVLADGTTGTANLELSFTSYGAGPEFQSWLSELKTAPRGGSSATPPMLLFLDGQGYLNAAGRVGPIETVDRVAFGTVQTPRKLSDCDGYVREGVDDDTPTSLPRQAIDEEVVVHDAHTGAELGRKTFAPVDFCPVELRKGDHILEIRPMAADITAWALSL